MTTINEIRNYLTVKAMPSYYELAGKPVSHMLMVCDTFSHEDYPVYVAEGQDINEIIKSHSNEGKFLRVMEVYSYKRDFEGQLKEQRSWHID